MKMPGKGKVGQMSRRAFVGASAAAAATLAFASAGCSPENKLGETDDRKIYRLDAELDESVDGKWITVPCRMNCGGRCLNKVFMVDGVAIRQKSDDVYSDVDDKNFQNRACPRGRAQQQECFGSDRLKYPIKRKNWEPGGGNRELRGIDEWVRLSWDEALGYIANETRRIYDTYGPRSVLQAGWGYGDVENILKTLGGFVSIASTESYGAWQYCQRAMGTSYINSNSDIELANDRLDLVNADTIVIYGANPGWAAAGSPSFHFLKAKSRGTQFVYVGPSRNVTANLLDAKWIPVRPSTDTAFMLGVAYVMITEDEEKQLIDWDFLHKYCIGFDAESMPIEAKLNENFKDYVLGEYDGIPKTPEWATEICGTPVEDIKWYADTIGKQHNVMLLHSYAAGRCKGAENVPQLFLTLGSMGGHLGRSGNACAAIYHYETANAGPRLVKMGAFAGGFVMNPIDDLIPGPVLWKSILDEKYLFCGQQSGPVTGLCPAEERDLKIQMIYSVGNDFLQSKINTNNGIKAYRKVEFVVAQDYKLSLACQYADIVLPITTKWEGFAANPGSMDGWINRDSEFFITPALEEGLFESHSDRWVAEQLAELLNLDYGSLFPATEKQQYFEWIAGAEVFTGGKLRPTQPAGYTGDSGGSAAAAEDADPPEIWEPIVKITQEDIDSWDVKYEPHDGLFGFDEIRERGVYQIERTVDDGKGWIGYQDFVNNPEKYPRPSASGKIEIYCQAKADMLNQIGFTSEQIKPYPHYIVAVDGYEASFDDWDGKVKGEFDLQMYTPHYIRRAHTTFDNLPWLQEAFENPVYLNAADADVRGITVGDTVLVSSKYGQILRHASVLESIMPGAVGVPHGVRSDIDPETGIDKGGSENVLLGPVQSNFLPQLSGYNTCLVKVEKYSGNPIPYDYEKQFVVEFEQE